DQSVDLLEDATRLVLGQGERVRSRFTAQAEQLEDESLEHQPRLFRYQHLVAEPPLGILVIQFRAQVGPDPPKLPDAVDRPVRRRKRLPLLRGHSTLLNHNMPSHETSTLVASR